MAQVTDAGKALKQETHKACMSANRIARGLAKSKTPTRSIRAWKKNMLKALRLAQLGAES